MENQYTVRRFGREGFSVALISRTQENVDRLAADLGLIDWHSKLN